MDCVNHNGVSATAYCQNCGKALCAECVRNAAGGQILCEPCLTAWQSFHAQAPFVPVPPPGTPSPVAAAVLGAIPGVGAMYNGQFMKGLMHVVIFAALVSAAHIFAIFGILIAGWIVYQMFDAYHTAKARRDGEPLPDPLGLNDVGKWFNAGMHPHMAGQPPAAPATAAPTEQQQQAPYAQGPYQAPYQQPYQAPYAPPAAGPAETGAPPVPPPQWRRKEPVGAIVLIALGVLFLLAQMGIFSARIFGYLWPLVLIGLGVWLILRRREGSQGGSK